MGFRKNLISSSLYPILDRWLLYWKNTKMYLLMEKTWLEINLHKKMENAFFLFLF